MDALSPSNPAQEVVLCFSSQTGKTEVCNNFVGFIIAHDPGPTLVIQPNMKPMAEAWSKDRLAPMIRDTPALRGKIAYTKNRGNKNNTTLHKTFPGGHITVGGANSPAGLASRPIRYLIFDEVSRYEVTKEGHAVPLATKRTTTFWNRKILKVSSPTFENEGILAELDDCDTISVRCLPCMHCGEVQYPGMRHFKWVERNVSEAVYVCEHCDGEHPLSYEHRAKMRGAWQCIREGAGRKVGFRMNQFASPFASWLETLEEFLGAKDTPDKLQAFVNTALCEPWEDPGETIESNVILGRREKYGADIPEGVSILTAGIDVQADRLELYAVGFGQGEEMWFIDAMPLYGLTDQPDVWLELDQALAATYKTADGAEMGISAAFIDEGYRTDLVREFCSTRYARRIFASKGISGESKDIIGHRSQYRIPGNRRRGWTYPIGVDGIKSLLYSRLNTTAPGPGYIHVPAGHALFGDEFAEQLTAEKIVTVHRKGFPVRQWHKTRPRNEALDCTVLCIAALRLVPGFEHKLALSLRPKPKPKQAAMRRPPESPREPTPGRWLNVRGKWL